jgi:hypothetical protein
MLQCLQSKYLKDKVHAEFIPVYALYHGGDESKPVLEQILCDADHRGIRFPQLSSLRTPLRSSAGGKLISATDSDASLIHIVLHSVMVECVDWHVTWDRISTYTGQNEPSINSTPELFAFGPYSPSLFPSAGAKSNTLIKIIDRSRINENTTTLWPPESIAIVGMAVDFPEGSDKDAFWNTLDTGVNTVQKVSV